MAYTVERRGASDDLLHQVIREGAVVPPLGPRPHHALIKAVLAEALDVLQDAYAKRSGVPGGRTGSIAVVQRCGSARHLNIHYHILMVDGCYSRA
jgi:hypothetical protein